MCVCWRYLISQFVPTELKMSSLLHFHPPTVSLYLPDTLTHVYTLAALVSAYSDKVSTTKSDLHSTHHLLLGVDLDRQPPGTAWLPFPSIRFCVSLFVCSLCPSSSQILCRGELSLILRNVLSAGSHPTQTFFLPLQSVATGPAAVPMNTLRQQQKLHFVPSVIPGRFL